MLKNEFIKDNVLKGINDFIRDHFSPNPYLYLFENDIQSHLFCILRERINEKFKVNNHILDLIYTEYANKFDLVCLDAESTSQKYPCNDKNINFHKTDLANLPLLLGIEIKYLALGPSKDYCEQCRLDELKLRKHLKDRRNDSPHFQYLALSFLQKPKSSPMKVETMVNEGKLEKPLKEIAEYNSGYVIAGQNIYKLPAKVNPEDEHIDIKQ
jgi:hypothetical protein